jgi:UDP-N-acetylmuramoylalanine--D-glutamate ligase
MIRIPHEPGRPVAVLGLGKSGLVAARALAASGAEVWAWDDDTAKRAAIATTDLYNCDWSRPSALVLSPGIPHEFPKPHPVAAKAKAAHVPVIGEVELLFRAQPKATFIGITGTNGKSTTTALIGHILRRSGKRAEVGANLGTPALALAPLEDGGIYVLEMSSYQLELVPTARFDVAVLLNITPDHLDRHGGMAGYVAAKRRIFDRQRSQDWAVIGIDDEYCRAIRDGLTSRHVMAIAIGRKVVSGTSIGREAASTITVRDGILSDESGRAIMDLATAPALPGPHNWQNAAAAFAVARALGISSASIAAGIETYPGLPHRQELIDTGAGVRFINDSKATNADATAKALACYEPIYWILGGRPKENGLEGLEPFYPRIARAYLIGEAAPAFGRTLDAHHVATRQCGTLDRAVAEAAADAAKEGRANAVVLLSPACASFDQFANFEERGDRFRALVQGLGQKAGRA